MSRPLAPEVDPAKSFAAEYRGAGSFAVVHGERTAPGHGEVRLAVAHVGICGTDRHAFHGRMDARIKPPSIIGHEMSGTVVELGDGVGTVAVGDRVVVRPLVACGTCPACVRGHRHICQRLRFLGLDAPGAFQSSWTVPAHTLHHVPPGLSSRHAALIEPLAVACHDLGLGQVTSGETVAVVGGGPIGLLVALVAGQRGCRCVVIEPQAGRRDFALSLGLHAISPEVAVAEVEGLTGGAGADVVVECSGAPSGVRLMTSLARVRGHIVIVGIATDPPPVDLFRCFWRELTIQGARVYEPEDFEDAIAVAATGVLPLDRLISAELPLADIQGAFTRLDAEPDLVKVLVACGPGWEAA